MTKKTWADIETRAINEPVLHLAVALVQRGDLTREEALIAAALGLSEQREKLHQAQVDQLNRCTCRTSPSPLELDAAVQTAIRLGWIWDDQTLASWIAANVTPKREP